MHSKKKYPENSFIKVDFINLENNFIIEYKKNILHFGSEMQAYIYMLKLNNSKVKIKYAEIRSLKDNQKIIVKYPSKHHQEELRNAIKWISNKAELPKKDSNFEHCKNCSLFAYCWCSK